MPALTPFDLNTTVRDGLAIVTVAGELDCATAPRLSQALGGLAEPGRVILVDLSDTEFIDCAGIAPLAAACQRQRQLGGDLILDVISEPVAKLIDWTGLDQVITLASRPATTPSHQPGPSRRSSESRS